MLETIVVSILIGGGTILIGYKFFDTTKKHKLRKKQAAEQMRLRREYLAAHPDDEANCPYEEISEEEMKLIDDPWRNMRAGVVIAEKFVKSYEDAEYNPYKSAKKKKDAVEPESNDAAYAALANAFAKNSVDRNDQTKINPEETTPATLPVKPTIGDEPAIRSSVNPARQIKADLEQSQEERARAIIEKLNQCVANQQTKQVIHTPHKRQIISTAPLPRGFYSQGMESNNFIFTSGQLPLGQDNTVAEGAYEQTIQALENIRTIVIAGGSSLEQIVKCTVYVTDIAMMEEVNAAFGEYFSEPYPARSCIVVTALPAEALVMIEAIAFCS